MRAIFGFAGIAFLIGISANVASSEKPPVPLELTIAEDAAPGAVIGRVVDESSAATHSVVHEGRAVPFVIDRQTGELTLTDLPLDFETQPRHEFVVRSRRPRAIDQARRAYLADLLASGVDSATMDDLLFETVEQHVAVLISDVPERPVLSTTPLQIQFGQTGESNAAQVAANDPDSGDVLTYELMSDDAESFAIDPQSGRLTYRDSIAAVAGSHPVTVRVTDSTGLSDAATFNVEVVIATPAVAAGAPEIVPAERSATSEPVEPAVTVVPSATAEDPEAIITESDTVVVVPETSSTPLEPAVPETFVEPEPETDPEVAVTRQNAGELATPIAAAALDGTAAVPPAVAAGEAPARSILHWLPLIPVVAGGVFAGVWYWRRRRECQQEPARGPFRVVRDAPDAVLAVPSKKTDAPIELIDHLLEPRLQSLETDLAQKAAMRELMATAFQQSAGITQTNLVPPPPPTESPVSAPLTVELPIADAPLIAASAEARFDDDAVIEEPVPQSPYGFDAALQAEAGLPPVPEAVGDESEPGFGTEPFAMPYPEAGQPVDTQSIEVELDAALAAEAPIESSYGYGVEDEELAGGYQGLRLSNSSEPPPLDEPVSHAYGAIETQEFHITPETSLPEPELEAEDPKLHDLRRQLSDLFGVPADRSRPTSPPVCEDEPVEAEAAIEEPVAAVPAPLPAAPPPPPVVDESPALVPPAPTPASDPVNSWLEYLKQRALEKPGTPAAPVVHVPQPQTPKAPSKPAINPAAVAAARKSTTPTPVRQNKSAVREEITMLRDLANRHSRNVLARRALTQKARMTWVLWGTALIVLCFSALWGVRHDAGGIRVLGWLLLGGAAIALGCCIYGFRSLTRGPADEFEEEELDAARLAADLEATAAPDLMTPEMEQRLRQVLEEARNVPETVESR